MALPHSIRFGVSRSHGGRQPVNSAATAFAEVLGRRAGTKVDLVVAADYDELTKQLLDGKVHVAWMPPLAHARASQRGAMVAAVVERQGAITYRSALLVRHDSVYVGLGGLRGVRAAWTDPSSAGGHLFPRLHLQHAGIDPRRDLVAETFHGSAHDALQAVVDGKADVCACYVSNDTADAIGDVERVYPGARDVLRVVGVTDPIPPDGIVLSGRLDPAVQAQLRDVLLDLHNHDDGRLVLDALMQAERLRGVTSDVLKILARLRAHVHA